MVCKKKYDLGVCSDRVDSWSSQVEGWENQWKDTHESRLWRKIGNSEEQLDLGSYSRGSFLMVVKSSRAPRYPGRATYVIDRISLVLSSPSQGIIGDPIGRLASDLSYI